MELSIDDTFKSVIHAVAMNENRYQFAKRSIYENVIEAGNKNDKKLREFPKNCVTAYNPLTGE
ncbi:hypothetical protein HQR03_08515 [Psychrobacter okhotskensis]|uniref:hypothetical protein n=1 Tax=Psychrobacter okhotskensis TaxID=212403 RepID=UPI0015677875|nr:hypothetical protein [Psychrobacter okhotskensis]NRD70576.1 hypothetical protein [Psychrobacter okhotskensis]